MVNAILEAIAETLREEGLPHVKIYPPLTIRVTDRNKTCYKVSLGQKFLGDSIDNSGFILLICPPIDEYDNYEYGRFDLSDPTVFTQLANRIRQHSAKHGTSSNLPRSKRRNNNQIP